MATIRKQRGKKLVVLAKDNAKRHRDVAQAVRAPGSFFLPSVSGSMRLQAQTMREYQHGTARRLAHASTHPVDHAAWSGRWVTAGPRACSVISTR